MAVEVPDHVYSSWIFSRNAIRSAISRRCHGFLQSLGHQRLAGAWQSRRRCGGGSSARRLAAAEGEAAGRFGGDEPGDDRPSSRAMVYSRNSGEASRFGSRMLTRISSGVLRRTPARFGPTAWPRSPSLWQARHSRSKIGRPRSGWPGAFERGLVSRDRRGPGTRCLAAEQIIGPLADRRVAVFEQDRTPCRRDLARRDDPGLDRVEQGTDPGRAGRAEARRPRRGRAGV